MESNQHTVTLLAVIGSTLAFNVLLVLLFFLFNHFFGQACGIPHCCFFNVYISSFVPLLSSLLIVLTPFLFAFSSHTLPVLPQNPVFLLSFPHLHLILLCYHTVNSARAPFMPFHFPSPTPSDKNQFLWQELWQQISITLITNCTVEIEKRSKIKEKTHQIAEARRICKYQRGQRSISLQPVVQPECSGGSLCKLEGGWPNLCLFFLLSRISVWNHPGES